MDKIITSEEVIRAYQETGLTPVNSDWGDGINCACPAMALAVYYGIFNPEECDDENALHEMADSWISAEYGVNYSSKFIAGVDEAKDPFPPTDNPGPWEQGRRVWSDVLKWQAEQGDTDGDTTAKISHAGSG